MNKKTLTMGIILIISAACSVNLVAKSSSDSGDITQGKAEQRGIIRSYSNDIFNIRRAPDDNTLSIKKFLWPVDENWGLSSNQGLRDSILDNTGGLVSKGGYHKGLDIKCPEGTKVRAAKEGVVTTVYPGYVNGSIWRGHSVYGGLIIIEHPDHTQSMYAHLSYTMCREGDHVEAGQYIGKSGGDPKKPCAGKSTGPHLHFEIFLDMNDNYFWESLIQN